MNIQEFKKRLQERSVNLLYLSGHVTSLGYKKARVRFNTFQELLEREDIISVSTFSRPHPKQRVKAYYIKNGIRELVDCGAILILGDNKDSEGSTIEENLATDLKMPIFRVFWDSEKDIKSDNLTIIEVQ